MKAFSQLIVECEPAKFDKKLSDVIIDAVMKDKEVAENKLTAAFS